MREHLHAHACTHKSNLCYSPKFLTIFIQLTGEFTYIMYAFTRLPRQDVTQSTFKSVVQKVISLIQKEEHCRTFLLCQHATTSYKSRKTNSEGPGDLGSITGRVIPKTLKMLLDTSLLNTQHYKVRIEGIVEQSRERSSALPDTSV